MDSAVTNMDLLIMGGMIVVLAIIIAIFDHVNAPYFSQHKDKWWKRRKHREQK